MWYRVAFFFSSLRPSARSRSSSSPLILRSVSVLTSAGRPSCRPVVRCHSQSRQFLAPIEAGTSAAPEEQLDEDEEWARTNLRD
jgi:hypothetical protein